MQTILHVKTLNSRKQISCPECESTSLAKINLRKISSKINRSRLLTNVTDVNTMVTTLI